MSEDHNQNDNCSASLECPIKAELCRALENTLVLTVLKYGNMDPDANIIIEQARAALAKAGVQK